MDYEKIVQDRKDAVKRMDMVVSLCGLAMFILCLMVLIFY